MLGGRELFREEHLGNREALGICLLTSPEARSPRCGKAETADGSPASAEQTRVPAPACAMLGAKPDYKVSQSAPRFNELSLERKEERGKENMTSIESFGLPFPACTLHVPA